MLSDKIDINEIYLDMFPYPFDTNRHSHRDYRGSVIIWFVHTTVPNQQIQDVQLQSIAIVGQSLRENIFFHFFIFFSL
jgi:hypothetical protein